MVSVAQDMWRLQPHVDFREERTISVEGSPKVAGSRISHTSGRLFGTVIGDVISWSWRNEINLDRDEPYDEASALPI